MYTNGYWKRNDQYQSNRTQFSNSQSTYQQKLPQSYTEGEKKDALMNAIGKWVLKNGEELKMDAMDLVDQWEPMLMAEWLEDLINIVKEMDVDEALFEECCQASAERDCNAQLAADHEYPHQMDVTTTHSVNDYNSYGAYGCP